MLEIALESRLLDRLGRWLIGQPADLAQNRDGTRSQDLILDEDFYLLAPDREVPKRIDLQSVAVLRHQIAVDVFRRLLFRRVAFVCLAMSMIAAVSVGTVWTLIGAPIARQVIIANARAEAERIRANGTGQPGGVAPAQPNPSSLYFSDPRAPNGAH